MDSLNRKTAGLRLLLISAAALVAPAASQASTYQWDVNGATAGLGGTGTWTSTASYWDLLGSGSDTGSAATVTRALDQSANILQFGGATAGTVSLSGASKALGLIFTGVDGNTLSTGATSSNSLTVYGSGIVASQSATITGKGSIVLGANQTWSVAAGKVLSIQNSVSGAFAITKTGSGTLELLTDNSFSGGIAINGGTLQLGANGYASLGSTGVISFGGGTLRYSGSWLPSATFTDLSTRFSGAAGQLYAVDTNNFWVRWESALNSVGGSLSATSTTGGTLVLAAASTYSGGTTINGVNVFVENDMSLGSGAISVVTGNISSNSARTIENALSVSQHIGFGGGNLGYNAAIRLSGPVSLASQSVSIGVGVETAISGVISGSGSKLDIWSSSGSLSLLAANTYTGGTTVSRGIVRVGNNAAFGTGEILFENYPYNKFLTSDSTTARSLANNIRFLENRVTLGGSGEFGGALRLNGAIDLGGVTRTITIGGDVTFGGSVSNGGLDLKGTGCLTMSGVNTYAGQTTLWTSGFTLRVGSSALNGNGLYMYDGTSLTSDSSAARTISGSFQINSNATLGADSLYAGDLVFSGSGAVSFFGGQRTVNSVTFWGGELAIRSNVTFAGDIWVGAINKSGAGTLTLSATNSYSGGTSVLEGVLVVNGTTGSGDVVVAQQGTLKGTGSIAGNAVISGVHAPGNSPGIQTFGSNLTYNSGAVIQWELGANTVANSPLAFDQVVAGGNLTFAGNVGLLLSFNWSGSSVNWGDAFWTSDHAWILFDVAGATAGVGRLSLSPSDWKDSAGRSFAAVRDAGNFSISQAGSDVYLNYMSSAPLRSAVPEPSTYGLALGGLALAAAAIRRRRKA